MSDSRTILVTGASRGIGLAIAEHLHGQGHQIIALSRSPQSRDDSRWVSVAVDVTDTPALESTVKQLLAEYPRLDAVVSNAGGPAFGHLEQLSAKHVEEGIALNLTSHIQLTRLLLGHLKRQSHADVILMGSESALRGGKQGTVYCAAKFGLRGFGQALRMECTSSPVRVTLIHPGMVRTPFFEDLDFGPAGGPFHAIEPDDIAAAVALVLEARPGTVFEELTVAPHKNVVEKKKAHRDK